MATSTTSNILRSPATTAGARRRQAPDRCRSDKRFGAQVLIEKLEVLIGDLGAVLGFDRARIGEIGPRDAPLGVPSPGGMRDRVEQRAQRGERAVGLGVAVAQARQLQAVAGDVANAHDRVAGDRASVDLEMASFQARGGDRERLASAEQSLDRLLRLGGEPGLEPRRERQHAARQGRVGDQREVALDPRVAVGPFPGDEYLRLAGQKEIGAIEPGARAGEFARQFALPLRPSPPSEQMQRGGQDREKQQQQNDEAGDVGRQRRLARRQRGAEIGARARRRRQSAGATGDDKKRSRAPNPPSGRAFAAWLVWRVRPSQNPLQASAP